MRQPTITIVVLAAALVCGCQRADETAGAAAAPQAPMTRTRSVTTLAPVDRTPSGGGATGNQVLTGDALLEANDRAIEENKRLIAMLGRRQAENPDKYQRLRKSCEAQTNTPLESGGAAIVARCIDANWASN